MFDIKIEFHTIFRLNNNFLLFHFTYINSLLPLFFFSLFKFVIFFIDSTFSLQNGDIRRTHIF